MKRLFVLFTLCMAQVGCASQAVNLYVRDRLTHEPLNDVEVTLSISHPPKEFFGSRWLERKEIREHKDNVFHFSYPLDKDLKCLLIIYKKGYYYTTYKLSKEKTHGNVDLTLCLNPVQKSIPLLAFYWHGQDVTFVYDGNKGIKRYDCLKADWLPPDGQGVNADMEFSFQQHSKEGKTFAWFSIRFTNPNDGFEEVRERYAEDMRIREAPATRKLQNQLDFIVESRNGLVQNAPQLKDYAFRVRTQQTPSGEILSAYYGKLYNAFTLKYGKDYWRCDFEYYLNPTPNDRNLEYNGRSINKPKERVNEIRRIR